MQLKFTILCIQWPVWTSQTFKGQGSTSTNKLQTIYQYQIGLLGPLGIKKLSMYCFHNVLPKNRQGNIKNPIKFDKFQYDLDYGRMLWYVLTKLYLYYSLDVSTIQFAYFHCQIQPSGLGKLYLSKQLGNVSLFWVVFAIILTQFQHLVV